MDKPVIKFRVAPAKHEEIKEYAKEKGYGTSANLTRVALFYFMRKNPLKKAK